MPLLRLDPWLRHRPRDGGAPPTLVVLHATAGGTARSSIDHLRAEGLGYHYVIARDGRDAASSVRADGSAPIVWQCAPDAMRTSHVGSTVPSPSGRGSINNTSIGVALANRQQRVDREPYPAAQRRALDELLARLRVEVPTLRWLTTHAVVQPWNRSDPLGLDGRALAARHRYEWWAPDTRLLALHRPPRTTV